MAVFTQEVLGPLTDAELRAVAVPISGTVTANVSGTVPVSGPLTDTQLRAAAVPISGTVTATGPLTDTQLRATAVPVSGPLTDTQLRATAVPVSFSTTSLTPTVTRVAVSATVATLLTASGSRQRFVIHNETGTLYVKFGSAATDTDYTYRLTANQVLEINYGMNATVTAIKASGASQVQVTSLA